MRHWFLLVMGLSSFVAVGTAFGQTTRASQAASAPATQPARRTIQGTVIDAKTGQPVVGARISYVAYASDLLSSGTKKVDSEREVVSDAQGRFEVVGPFYGLDVRHERYWTQQLRPYNFDQFRDKASTRREFRFRIPLSAGADVGGTVRDADGKPIVGARASAAGEPPNPGKSAVTDAKGEFVIYSPKVREDGSTFLTVEAKGFVPFFIKDVKPGGPAVSVVLERPWELVVKAQGPDGQFLKEFAAGVEAPMAFFSTEVPPKMVQAEPGQVRMTFHRPGKRALWVSAGGYALAETTVEVARGMAPVVVKLSEGVTVSGRAQIAGGKFDGGQATLHSAAYFFAPELRAPIQADGSFRFDHCGPGQFHLKVAIPGRTVAWAPVTVGQANVELPVVAVRGSGTVIGDFGPWYETRGMVVAEDGQQFEFQPDKDGRFRVQAVSLGKARVIVTPKGGSGCVVVSLEGEVEVRENMVNEARFADNAAPAPATQAATPQSAPAPLASQPTSAPFRPPEGWLWWVQMKDGL